MGVTGARDQVSDRAESLVARVRAATSLPVCVGLGVSTAAQAAEVASYADGVIVGSAFVRRLLDAPSAAEGVAAVAALAAELAAGVRRPPDPPTACMTVCGERGNRGGAPLVGPPCACPLPLRSRPPCWSA